MLEDEQDFITSWLRSGDVAVDVGANIGVLALAAGWRVGPTGRVIAIEPHPRTFASLRANVSLNDVPWIDCMQAACGSRASVTWMTDRSSDDQNAMVLDDAGAIPVVMSTLDELVGDAERINLLKIDVEGYEKYVLDGGQRTLAATDAVYCEVSQRLTSAQGYDADEIVGLLHAAGFEVLAADTRQPVRRPFQPREPVNVISVRDTGALASRFGL